MPPTQKHKQAQREKVMLGARKCFVRHGFHATGMADIARTCRMSVGNLYHYFPHKNAIIQAITDQIRSRMLPVLEPLRDHPNPLEGLAEIMRLSVEEIATGSNARLWMEILAEAPRNKVIRNICQTVDRDLQAVLERLLHRAVRGGQLPGNTDLEGTALWLVAMLDGAIARASAQPGLDLCRLQRALAQNLGHFFGARAS